MAGQQNRPRRLRNRNRPSQSGNKPFRVCIFIGVTAVGLAFVYWGVSELRSSPNPNDMGGVFLIFVGTVAGCAGIAALVALLRNSQ